MSEVKPESPQAKINVWAGQLSLLETLGKNLLPGTRRLTKFSYAQL